MRKILVLIMSLALAMLGLVAVPAASQAQAPAAAKVAATSYSNGSIQTFRTVRNTTHPFFGHALPPVGTTLHNVVIVPDKLKADTITVTSEGGSVTGTAVLNASGHTLHTSFTWTDSHHWKFTIEYNADPEQPTHHTTALNLNHVTGIVEATGSTGQINLILHGYAIGNSTYEIQLHVNHHGFEGSVQVNNLVISGITYPHAQLSVSNISAAARIQGTMETGSGTFTIDAYVMSLGGGGYRNHLKVTGSDLKFKTATTKLLHFHFEKTVDTAGADNCAAFSATFGGAFEMKSQTYTLHQAHLSFSCGKLTALKFHISVAHTDKIGVTTTVTLAIALLNTPGSTDALSGPGVQADAIHYAQCLCGYVDMNKKKNFEKEYKGKEFHRSIKIGIVFGLALYTPQDNPGGHVQAMIGAGGYFSADRVSGEFGCTYETHSSDFKCTGKIRINPAWAGVYHLEYGLYI